MTFRDFQQNKIITVMVNATGMDMFCCIEKYGSTYVRLYYVFLNKNLNEKVVIFINLVNRFNNLMREYASFGFH